MNKLTLGISFSAYSLNVDVWEDNTPGSFACQTVGYNRGATHYRVAPYNLTALISTCCL
ncbi:hypothetical protein ES703_33778 [subsurface metagenome]